MEIFINTLELFGTLFLGIEAIKLKNFEIIQIYLKSINSYLNPTINWIDENEMKSLSQKEKTNYNFDWLLLGLFLLSGIIYFCLNCFAKIDILNFIPTEKNNWFYIPKVFLGILIGPILWTFIIYFFEFIIFLLSKLEKNTKTGVIGLLGIFIFIVTFVLKILVKE
jgi:hypothetical protein